MADSDIRGIGYRLILRSGTVTKKIQNAIIKGLDKSGQKYYDAVIENISLDDHTLAELARLGHPYSISGKPVHGDDRQVHEQSGKLKESISMSSPEQETQGTYSVYLSSDDPVMEYLLNGTSRMRPRRFDEKAIEDIGEDNLFKDLEKSLKGVSHKIEEV